MQHFYLTSDLCFSKVHIIKSHPLIFFYRVLKYIMTHTASLTGFINNLSEQQARALAELREIIGLTEYAVDVQKDPEKDQFLLRFLRASMQDKTGCRIFVVEAAMARIIKTLEWRRKYGLNEMRDKIERGDITSARPDAFAKFEKVYPVLDVINEDTGELVRLFRFGQFVNRVNHTLMSTDEWIQCFAYDSLLVQHTLRKLSAKYNKDICTFAVIVDVMGINLVEVASKIKFIQMMSNVAAENFPETLGQTLVIRTPRIFHTIFTMVKPFIDKDTVAKVVISSGMEAKLLNTVVPVHLLPQEYGGSSTEQLKQPIIEP